MNYSKRSVKVLGHIMSYIEIGEGKPIVFLHGNPTSSYLWRNILPYLEGHGRLIAPDMIGMGDSAKLFADEPERYRFVCHRRYLEAFLNAVGADKDVTFVLHDWGGAFGFDWANRHREAVKAIAYMETFARPLGWSDLPEGFHPTLKAVRSSEGEKLVLEENMFIEKMLPSVTMRELTSEEMDNYRRPYLTAGEDRLPTLVLPREVPIDGQPADVASAMSDYSEWLKDSQIPKLFINADPGVFITGEVQEFCQTWSNQTEVTVSGTHFLQEDSPEQIGKVIAQWCDSLS